MNARAYKIVFIVLSVCVLGIIVLQAYWLRSFYQQEITRFNSTVYSALELASTKIKDKEALGVVKDQLFVRTQTESQELYDLKKNLPEFAKSAAIKKKSKHQDLPNLPQLHTQTLVQSAVITSEGGKQLYISQTTGNGSDSKSTTRVQIFTDASPKKELLIENLDSAQLELKSRIDSVGKLVSNKGRQHDVDLLVDKVMMEIKLIDTEISNRDTLSKLISEVLRNKGIFQNFEFAYYHSNSDTAKPFLQSDGYKPQQETFKTDLNIQNVIKRNRLLALQFPNRRDAALAAMSGSLWVSGIFSLIVLLAFFYAILLIRKQKNMTELRNDFVNNMTHELKTPLATMSLALDAMGKEQVKKDEDRIELYRRILKEENEKMNQHVERVLQLSVMDKTHATGANNLFSASDIIKRSVANFKLKAEQLNISIQLKDESPNTLIKGDASQFELAINNLIDNALKYSAPHSQVDIHVSCDDQHLLISISDSGAGIDKAHHEKIFEKFYRVQGGDVHDVKGFGLGLSFVKQIIGTMQGTVQVASRLGQGSTFTIQLPLHG